MRRVPPFSWQTHPNVDKKLFTAESVIGLKNPEKSFPLNNDVGVLKWRLQTTDESLIPLTSKRAHALEVKTSVRLCLTCASSRSKLLALRERQRL